MDAPVLRSPAPGRTQGKLIGAARHWASARTGAAPDSERGSADAFNVTVEGWDHEEDREFCVWEENWPSIQAFLLVRTQWIRDQGVPTGLNYASVDIALRRHRVEEADRIFGDLTLMETAILATWATERERHSR